MAQKLEGEGQVHLKWEYGKTCNISCNIAAKRVE